jgi:CRISPR-associated RAMP protein (TIGR02581 family)
MATPTSLSTFLELRSRYLLTCYVKAEEGLHVGSGTPVGESDSPFIQENGEAFLPGSTLRGAMRSTLERLSRALFPPGSPRRPCMLFVRDEDNEGADCACAVEKTRKKYEADTGAMETALRKGELRLCPVCQLFGSTLMAARLKVGDARFSAGAKEPVIRDGVGIDRDTETAKEKIKYNFEVLDPGPEFRFEIQVENAEESDFALLHILLQEMKRGMEVGGKKSRGLGKIVLTKYEVKYFDGARGHGLGEFLAGGYGNETTTAFERRLVDAFQQS